jgi:hypothetical protein
LVEADPDSINLLISSRINKVMNTRPEDITDEDLEMMVSYYRNERARFIIESQAKPPRAKPSAKPTAKTAASAQEALANAADTLNLL